MMLLATIDAALASVFAAIVTGVAGVLIALIQQLRKENNRDHARNTDILYEIDEKIDHVQETIEKRIGQVEGKIDHHVTWHLEKGDR